MRATWMMVLLGLEAGCSFGGSDAVVPGAGECQDSEGAQFEAKGTMTATIDGLEWRGWRMEGYSLPVDAPGSGSTRRLMRTYGCVLRSGEQPAEWSLLLTLPSVVDQPLSLGSGSGGASFYYGGALNHTEGASDIDDYIFSFSNLPGEVVVAKFDEAAGVLEGTLDAQLEPGPSAEPGEVVQVSAAFSLEPVAGGGWAAN
jgi:hypothetical protein